MQCTNRRVTRITFAFALSTAFSLGAAANAARGESAKQTGTVRLQPPAGARFSLDGVVGDRMEANVHNWLLPAPKANPGMIEMFHVRDREPKPNLVPWAGEFVGKYLLSAIPALRLTESDALAQTVRQVVDDVVASQADDGYLGPFPKKQRLLGQWDLWGHYHVMRALVRYHEETGYTPAMDAALRAADLICTTYLDTDRRVIDAGAPEMNMSVIHVLAKLYRITGRERYWRMAKEIERDWERAGDYFRTGLAGTPFYRTPRPRWESLQCLEGLAELYRVTGDADYRTALVNHWESIRRYDRHNTGAFSTNEAAVGSPYRNGSIETCCTVAWMALTIDVLTLTGDPTAADELEWSLFNAMLGAQHPSGRWWTYDTPMDGQRVASAHAIVFQARAGTPELNCCSVNAPRSLALLTDWAVLLDDAGLVINYYGPCTMRLPDVRGTAVTIEQQTRYPADGRITLVIKPDQTARFNLRLRIPGWSRQTTVRVNGKPIADVTPGTYLSIDRDWRPGDRIELNLDMSPRYWNGDAERAGTASVYYGPLLLAYDQHHNTRDTHEVPVIDLAALKLEPATCDDRFQPTALFDVPATDGTTIRLCDFATAGAYGTFYRSWLPAKNGVPADFYLEQPAADANVPTGVLVFDWIGALAPGPGNTRYDLAVSETPDFKMMAIEARDLTQSRYVHSEGLAPNRTYYWKVTARNEAGAIANADGPRQFTVDPSLKPIADVACVILDEGPDAIVIDAPLDGRVEPRRGCVARVVDIEPAADRNQNANGAIRLNGHTSRIQFDIPYFPGESYSAAAWVYLDAIVDKPLQQVFSAWCAGMDDPLRLSLVGDSFTARIEAGQLHVTPAATLEPKRWTHVAAVKNGATLTLYVDGRRVGETQVPARVTSASTSVAIGANPLYPGDEYFAGCVDDFRFHAIALSADQVAALARGE
jgi:DUF1680 family protein